MSGGDLVAIGYITEGSQDFHFTLSLDDAMRYDAAHEQQIAWPPIRNQSGVDLSLGRNEVVTAFLGTEAQWLLFIDTDMGFAPDAIARLRRSADPVTRPVVGGLCFSLKRAELTAEHGWHVNPHPTLYEWVERDAEAGFSTIFDYKRDAVQQVHGTGAAFLLIHRSVLERMRDELGPKWFTLASHAKAPKGFSEDMSFCLRLMGLGIPLHVDTSVKTCHGKFVTIDEWCYDTWPKLRPPLPDLIVTGSPFSDLGPVAEGLRTLGVPTGEGETFTLQGYQRWPDLKAAVHWATLQPLAEGLGDASVIRLVEHPLSDHNDLTPEQWTYVEKQCGPQIAGLDGIERDLAVWTLWNATLDALVPDALITTVATFPWKQAAQIAGVRTTKAEREVVSQDAVALVKYQANVAPTSWAEVPVGPVRAAAFDLACRLGVESPAGDTCDVVIPVKDHLDVTRGIIEQLSVHPGVGNVFVFDNGSGPETADYLRSQTFATVIDAAGLNIHEMWNQGLALCTPGRPVAVLNNDLRLGPDMFTRTLAAMEHGGLSVACPNYDGRPGIGIQPVTGICAGRYDGTGGLAGFAMFLAPDVVERYRFPEELEWWGGDNDLCSWLTAEGLLYGIALGAEVEHLDGGSVTFRELESYDPTEDLRLMRERIEARHA